MSLATLLTDTVTITPRSQDVTEDEYGDPVLEAAESFTSSARVQVGESEEYLEGENRVDYDALAFLPAGTVIGHLDRVDYAGDAYEVAGYPRPQKAPRGEHHIEVPLSRIVGG
jgi:hypothetical protein